MNRISKQFSNFKNLSTIDKIGTIQIISTAGCSVAGTICGIHLSNKQFEPKTKVSKKLIPNIMVGTVGFGIGCFIGIFSPIIAGVVLPVYVVNELAIKIMK